MSHLDQDHSYRRVVATGLGCLSHTWELTCYEHPWALCVIAESHLREGWDVRIPAFGVIWASEQQPGLA